MDRDGKVVSAERAITGDGSKVLRIKKLITEDVRVPIQSSSGRLRHRVEPRIREITEEIVDPAEQNRIAKRLGP